MPTKNAVKLKILFLSKSTPIYGGVERWLADLALGLEALGHDCLVALAQGAVFHDPKKYHAAYPKLKTVNLNGETGSPVGRQLAIRTVLYQYTPDIVIPVSLGDGLAISAYLKNRLDYKLIYPVHEVGQGIINDLKRYTTYIDSIIFVDQSSQDHYQPLLGPENHTQIIPCGVLSRQQLEKIEDNTTNNVVKIGHCGRIAKGKRAMDLIPFCDALDNIGQDFTLDIVGEGLQLEALQAGLENRLNRKSNGSVRIHKPIDRDQLYEDFYQNIDVLLITSELETGPLVAFEAMMNRAVVITSNFRGRTENKCLVDGENCLVFPIGEVAMAANHIKRVSSDIEIKKRMIKTAYDYASNQRTLETMCESWHQLALSLAARKSTHKINDSKQEFTTLPLTSLNQRIKEYVRKIFRIRFLHKNAGEEWPFFSSAQDNN